MDEKFYLNELKELLVRITKLENQLITQGVYNHTLKLIIKEIDPVAFEQLQIIDMQQQLSEIQIDAYVEQAGNT